jgi:uncharacterized protein YodC (DUF2158 family)
MNDPENTPTEPLTFPPDIPDHVREWTRQVYDQQNARLPLGERPVLFLDDGFNVVPLNTAKVNMTLKGEWKNGCTAQTFKYEPKVGDVVTLRSGGPKMTIEGFQHSYKIAHCLWFVGGNVEEADFGTDTLCPVDEEARI